MIPCRGDVIQNGWLDTEIHCSNSNDKALGRNKIAAIFLLQL